MCSFGNRQGLGKPWQNTTKHVRPRQPQLGVGPGESRLGGAVFFLLSLVVVPATFASPALPTLTLSEQHVSLSITAKGTPDYRVWSVTSPPRIVIDIMAEESEAPLPKIDRVVADPLVSSWRQSESPEGRRLVLDLRFSVPHPDVSSWVAKGDGLYDLEVSIPRRFVNESEFFIGKGVRFKIQRRGETYGPLAVSVLTVDRHQPGVNIEIALANFSLKGIEPVSAIVERTAALAGVNGGFFHTDGLPLGLVVDEGVLIQPSLYDRSAFLVLNNGSLLISRVKTELQVYLQDGNTLHVNGVNRKRRAGEVVVYNHAFGPSTPADMGVRELIVRNYKVVGIGNGGTPLQPGTTVVALDSGSPLVQQALGTSCRVVEGLYLLEEERYIPMADVQLALGAGPRLVKSGEVHVTADLELFRPDVALGRAPRTALAITGDDRLLLVTVNGRQEGISQGQTLQELAELLLELGAVEAINLDGGASSTMVVRDKVVNMPSSGEERAVGDALLVFAPSL